MLRSLLAPLLLVALVLHTPLVVLGYGTPLPIRRHFFRDICQTCAGAVMLGGGSLASSADDSVLAPNAPSKNLLGGVQKKNSIWSFEPGEEFCVCHDGSCSGKNCNGLARAKNEKMSTLDSVSAGQQEEAAGSYKTCAHTHVIEKI